jgi:hypothetical protein
MSNFVEIRSSPGEIIGIANGIRSKGLDLITATANIRDDIVDHENRENTFPSDQFTDPFVHDNYHTPVPGADGKTTAANEAVRASAIYCGIKLVNVADFVSKAMVNYDAADQESGADIAKTET